MNNFWQHLRNQKRLITALAPMEEVTDMVFRQLIASIGRPDVFFTEFTSVEGINSVGRAKVIHRLQYADSEKPIVAQLWGTTPEHYKKAAQLAVELGFDGLDINMGCPVPKVIKRGACSALINNPSLAEEIVVATREGLKNKIPLSIKTRIGFKTIQTEEWIGFLLAKAKPDALTVHLRTVKELSEPAPHWEEMPAIMKMRDHYSPATIIMGNGNLESIAEIQEKVALTGMDGGMVGRGIFHNPWLFANRRIEEVSAQEKIQTLLKHTRLFTTTWGNTKNFSILKRFFKIYCNGFDGAKEIRSRLMECSNTHEIESVCLDLQFAQVTNS